MAEVPTGQGFAMQGIASLVNERESIGHTTIGGEKVFYKGLSAGGDGGAFYPFEAAYLVIGNANANVGYHFLAGRKNTKWDPFVSGGYSILFREGAVSGVNYGGGVVYWFTPRLGIRTEGRGYSISSGGSYGSMAEIRVGLSFR